ncbi:MAG: glycoside hydrolase family 5 protein [Firmicutes bacterium]|nr:glycoside hydrolase family 5 protein [Bacillota bacterium]
MRSARRIFLFLLLPPLALVLAAGLVGGGERFDSGPETEAVMPLGRGINMGNMLEAFPDEGAWGERVEKGYFALIAGRGFHTVRIPIRWSAHAMASAPYTIDERFFRRVEEVVGWALEQKLNVIINMHHYDEIFSEPDKHKERFIAMWKQIAGRFKHLDPQKVFFELLNEPHGRLTMDKWNGMIKETIAAIREIDRDHTIILSGTNWGGASGLKGLKIPKGETKVMATFHFYSPFNFTHQGAEWVNPSPPLGTKWPGVNLEAACKAIRNELDIAKAWSESHGGIPILLGEFGAYSKADMQSRVNWTAYVRKQAELRGFSWAYWEFCAGFGVYDNDAKVWHEPLMEALGLGRK